MTGPNSSASEAPLAPAYFARSALELAPALLGTELVHETPEGVAGGLIVEVEAYCGPKDRAAHSFGGRRTARTEAMYAPGGHAYVYQLYGMYFCFNVVAAGPGEPEAVLVRALEPRRGVELMTRRRGVTLGPEETAWLEVRERQPVWEPPQRRPSAALRRLTAGPGRLCRALAIARPENGLPLTEGRLLLRRGTSPVPPESIATGPRINVDYAGEWAARPWRFWIRGNPFVSR